MAPPATAYVCSVSLDSSLEPDGISAWGALSMFSSFWHTILFRSLSPTLQAAPRLWATSLRKKTCPPLSHCNIAQGESRLFSHPGDHMSCATERDGCERCLDLEPCCITFICFIYRPTSSDMLAFGAGQTIHSYVPFCHITPEHPPSDGSWPENTPSIETIAWQTCHALCYINQNEMSLWNKV